MPRRRPTRSTRLPIHLDRHARRRTIADSSSSSTGVKQLAGGGGSAHRPGTATSRKRSRLPAVTGGHSTAVGQHEHHAWLADSRTTDLPSWSWESDFPQLRRRKRGVRWRALGEASREASAGHRRSSSYEWSNYSLTSFWSNCCRSSLHWSRLPMSAEISPLVIPRSVRTAS